MSLSQAACPQPYQQEPSSQYGSSSQVITTKMFKSWLANQQFKRRKSMETGEQLRLFREQQNMYGVCVQSENPNVTGEVIYRLNHNKVMEPNAQWTGQEAFVVREETMDDLLSEGLHRVGSLKFEHEVYNSNNGVDDSIHGL
ncbi:DNA mismatch repair protein [Acrasis kona]|uniref:DNA mismatch repair protein n=1 Tax=Acrasis kona TaxID=1008807 RepID=A0AAW2ZN54_9EUKA